MGTLTFKSSAQGAQAGKNHEQGRICISVVGTSLLQERQISGHFVRRHSATPPPPDRTRPPPPTLVCRMARNATNANNQPVPSSPTPLSQSRRVALGRIGYIVYSVNHADFEWIEWNLDHATKHGCLIWEIEHVVLNASRPWPKNKGKGKFEVEGRGQGERVIRVLFLVEPDGRAFVIHAMPLTTRRRRN
jgi:hypothetical protein